eukprot:TRINITY_DN61438_c0_g1_i1.p2 TRINITY_DN61438_c0_g1~~TRINITY_DN61438_c0_g1_i1.p2  ORF type:complete len:202 (+),score=25.50 TRINITY_DN61438_c0_g1_i1:128-733(+)
MIRRPPRSTQGVSSAASDVYKRQYQTQSTWGKLPQAINELFGNYLAFNQSLDFSLCSFCRSIKSSSSLSKTYSDNYFEEDPPNGSFREGTSTYSWHLLFPRVKIQSIVNTQIFTLPFELVRQLHCSSFQNWTREIEKFGKIVKPTHCKEFLPFYFPYQNSQLFKNCLLYTSDAADDTPCVDLGGRRIIKKKKKHADQNLHP